MTLADLHQQLRILDQAPVPDQWREIEQRSRAPGQWTETPPRRRLASALVALVLAAGGTTLAIRALTPDERPGASPTPSESSPSPGADEVIEEMTEQDRAEVFAFRAVAASGLMDPFGNRSYLFTSREDTTRKADGWRIGFAASDCEPRSSEQASSFTCRGLSGEDPELGNALTDTFVTVNLDRGAWQVVNVEGNMFADDRDRVLGYELPERQEPSHWEFPAVGTWQTDEGTFIEMVRLWVGPYPTSALGSVCDVSALDGSGARIDRIRRFYEPAPSRPFERAGGLLGFGAVAPDLTQVSVVCRQYTGQGWKVTSDPEMVVPGNGIVWYVTAELEWRGEEGFTAAAVCRVTLVSSIGEVVAEGTERIWPLMRPNELKNYPYRTNVQIDFGAKPVSADGVGIGEFSCTTV
jgi:hypothetical protein